MQQFFSKKVPQDKKPMLRDMDSSASFVLLQMAAEEADNKDMSYDELRKFAEDTMMANGPRGSERAEDEGGKAEEEGKADAEGKADQDMVYEGPMEVEAKEEDAGIEAKLETEGPMQVEGKVEEVEVNKETEGPMDVECEEAEDQDEEQGGVVLANDL